MFSITPDTKAFICTTPVDMRASFDSLSGIVKSQLACNPLSGDLYVFFSRDRDRMKILLWQLDGFVLCYKRLVDMHCIFACWPHFRVRAGPNLICKKHGNWLQWLKGSMVHKLHLTKPCFRQMTWS